MLMHFPAIGSTKNCAGGALELLYLFDRDIASSRGSLRTSGLSRSMLERIAESTLVGYA